jgi:two-component system cell cycle response regulator
MTARILVIEDNPANLDLMCYLLEAYGHRTYTAEDGAEGIAVARRERPDLILCDVQMPVVDGYEVARRIKAEPGLRTIPLVAVTALAMVGDREKVLSAGFDGYVAKPIDPETFVARTQVYLRPEQHKHDPLPAAAAHPAAVTRPPANRAILVVDNLPVNLDLARSILEPHGYKVTTADGAFEGLKLARQLPFDLILSDVCMFEGNGYDFIQEVKADPRLRAIPFIFITSTMMDDRDRARGLALGAARFLRRPIEPHTLLAEIEACLREKEAR